jgi:CheY-like chemotaxis protein
MTDILSKKSPILLVEDDEIDVEAVMRALKKEHIANPLICANDGAEALEMLEGSNGHEKIKQPCLILLDINMPRMNGLQFLHEIRKHNVMKQNVVFMLTTSSRINDKADAYNLQAAGYILKENLGSLAHMLADYCEINEIP